MSNVQSPKLMKPGVWMACIYLKKSLKIFAQTKYILYLCNIVARQIKCNEICGPTKEKYFLSARVIFS